MKRNSFVASFGVAIAATLSVGFVNITPKVIYGEDNRADVYQVQRADIRELADSTVALIPARSVTLAENGMMSIAASSYGERMNLCSSEPYYDQPAAANCSGSLVGEDLVATAGHCISPTDCTNNRYSFVFGFRMLDEKNPALQVSTEDVYSCKEIVAREYNSQKDFALVRLDRVVTNRRPLTLQKEPVQKGDKVFVIGHPSGLPTKVADNAEVRAKNAAFFVTNLDTYGGNSGSAVFNAATNEVVGILVRGAQDFSYDYQNKCTSSNVCPETGCRGEDVTNITFITQALEKAKQ